MCIGKLWPFSSRLLASGLLNTFFQNLHALVIGKVYLPADLGYYTRASSLSMLPANSVNTMTGRVMFPVFSRMQHDKKRLREDCRKTFRIMAAFFFPVMAGMSAVARPLVSCLLTDKWLPCVPYLQILCFYGMLYPLHALHLNVLTAQGRSDLFFRLEVIKKMLIVVIIAATFWIGVLAMVCGMLAGSVIGLGINGYYTRRLIGYGWWQQFGDLAPVALVSLAMAAVVRVVVWVPGWSQWALLFNQILLGVGVYVALALILRRSVYADVLGFLSRTWYRRFGPLAVAASAGEG
jgi:O-antigen/teichoic acid export membrane protein